MWKQTRRIIAQKVKADKVQKIVTEDVGEHPLHENFTVHLNDRTEPLETYQSTIRDLIDSLTLDKKWHTQRLITSFILVFIKMNGLGSEEEILYDLNNGQNVFDLRGSLGMGICEPLFCKEFSNEIILDIVFAKIVVLIAIDYENIIEYAKLLGCNARWSTVRNTTK